MIFALSNETMKACWQLGSLSKSYKHCQFLEFFTTLYADVKKYFMYMCGWLSVSR